MPSYSFSLSGSYSSTAVGYQIGGNDNAKVTINKITLPSTYAKYGDTYIYLTFYSATAPSSWPSNYSFTINLTINGSTQSNLFSRNDAANYFDSLGSNKYRMRINLGTTFNSGTAISGSINSYTGAFVNGSSKCLYLCAAEFVSNDAYNTFKLSYNANGGTGAPSTQTKDTTATSYTFTISSTKPTLTNYDFKGWATSSNGNASYQPGNNYTVYSSSPSATLYAVWAIKTYTISYNANGGSGAPSSQTKTHNVTLTLTGDTPTREGYNFLGWAASSTATSATYQPRGSYTNNGSATLYAVWEKASYAVTFFNKKDGVDLQDPVVLSLDYETSIDLTDSQGFSRPGYQFIGWTASEDAAEPLTSYTVQANNTQALYSLWELLSNIRVYTDGEWRIAIPYVYQNGSWQLAISKVYQNNEWSQ